MTRPRFHRPIPLADLESLRDPHDPIARSETAHATAVLLLGDASGQRDEAATKRFVALSEEIGFDVIAEMWAMAPAVSAPGALWRLYALREWIRTNPRELSELFSTGQRILSQGIGLDDILAGVETPVGPDEVARAIDEILVGVFAGDVGIALLRASAFVRFCAAGDTTEDQRSRLEQLSVDLREAALAYRQGDLT